MAGRASMAFLHNFTFLCFVLSRPIVDPLVGKYFEDTHMLFSLGKDFHTAHVALYCIS